MSEWKFPLYPLLQAEKGSYADLLDETYRCHPNPDPESRPYPPSPSYPISNGRLNPSSASEMLFPVSAISLLHPYQRDQSIGLSKWRTQPLVNVKMI